MPVKYLLTPFLLMIAISGSTQPVNDTTAIKNLLERESASWRSGDIKAHAACWHIRPYSKIIVSTTEGKLLDVPPGTMLNPPVGMMGKGGHAVNSNYTFSIQKNTAWVSHKEVSTDTDGRKSYSYEIRMLEKIKGVWKLVAQSIHSYKAEEQPAATN